VLDKIVAPRGISEAARRTALKDAALVLDHAVRIGLDDARILDYFYAAERLRGRARMNEWQALVVPLLVPEFQRAALDMAPAERLQNALHTAVTARLMPAWANIPYFRRPRGEVQPARRPRLGSASDRDLIDRRVATPQSWSDGFDVVFVQRAWSRLRMGAEQPGLETLLQRVVWRSTFGDYLAEFNGEEPPPTTSANLVRRAQRTIARLPSQLRKGS
jgi:hypothetical protein